MTRTRFSVCLIAGALLFALAPVRAAEDNAIARMATCQDSWFEWQSKEPARLKALGEHFRAAFVPKGNDGSFVPKTKISIAGLNITRVYPGSLGMGVGFSLFVDAPIDKVRDGLKHLLGKPLDKCETSDSMRTCGSQIAAQRTLTVMASDDPKARDTLIGCYYFYEK